MTRCDATVAADHETHNVIAEDSKANESKGNAMAVQMHWDISINYTQRSSNRSQNSVLGSPLLVQSEVGYAVSLLQECDEVYSGGLWKAWKQIVFLIKISMIDQK